MSTLTKIFVVLLVVLVVGATPLFIHQAITPPNYMVAYKAEQKKVANAVAGKQLVEAENALDSSLHLARIDTLAEALRREREESRRQKDSADRSAVALADQVAMQKKQGATLTSLQKTLDGALDQQAATQAQLDSQIKVGLQLRAQLDRQDQDLKEMDRNVERATAAAKDSAEKLAARDARIVDLESQLAAGVGAAVAGGGGQPVQAAAAIKGRIVAVRVDKNVARLNVGSADGVTDGMQFILYRDNELVGQLVVAAIDANSCAGTLMNLQGTPQQGDWATTSLGPK